MRFRLSSMLPQSGGGPLKPAILLLLGVIYLLGPLQAKSAAWLQEAGKTQVIHNLFYYTTSEFFDETGERRPQEDFGKLEYNPFIQYGLNSSWTIGASLRFQHLRQENNGNANVTNALADHEWFARYALWRGDNGILSVQPMIKLPGLYDVDDQPNAGNAQIDYELRLLYGHSFSWLERYHYVNIEQAYRVRTEAPADEWRLDAAVGIRPYPGWLVLTEWQSVRAIDGGGTSSLQLVNSTDFDLDKISLSMVRTLNDRYSLQAGGFVHINGENTGAGGGFQLAVWTHF